MGCRSGGSWVLYRWADEAERAVRAGEVEWFRSSGADRDEGDEEERETTWRRRPRSAGCAVQHSHRDS